MSKTRMCFVSNSSSSSFIVQRSYFSNVALAAAESTGIANDWTVDSDSNHVRFSTYMDNFDMEHYLREECDIPDSAIEYTFD